MSRDACTLLGIGAFSTGVQEIWELRYSMMKHSITGTDKNITIFCDILDWQAQNIMNDTYRTDDNKFIKTDGLKFEKLGYNSAEQSKNTDNTIGRYRQYVGHSSESEIFLKIIKYIRKNRDRITLVGIEIDTGNSSVINNDATATAMIKHMKNKDEVYYFWAHNSQVDDRHRSCGHFLKKVLGSSYCIILSQSYNGVNRFNRTCSDKSCNDKKWAIKYLYKKFSYGPNERYVNKTRSSIIYDRDEFNSDLIEFTNTYYKNNKNGYSEIVKDSLWDYIVFYNTVTGLKPSVEY